MPALDQLIHDLRADGSVESEGRFTLDREQARAKMQKFQLVDARRYVLELVQAAVLRDATNIAFQIDADDMRLRFDGLAFSEAELDDLYGSLFGEGDTRALRGVRQLALALNAALGMDPKHITLRSGTVELRMAPGQRDEIIVHERAVGHTQIHVRQRLSLRTALDFFANLTGRLGEEQHLRTRCAYSTVPVSLDGASISAGFTAPGDLRVQATLPVRGADYRGAIMVVDRAERCELRLLKDGVWIDSRPLHRAGTHLVAVIEGEQLRKDVSQAKIVETAALERIEAAVLHARWDLWVLAARPELEPVIREQLLGHASFEELRTIAKARTLARKLVWRDCRDPQRAVSLEDLVDLVHAGHVPRYARSQFPELAVEGEPILWIERPEDIAALSRALARELIEADDLLARERRRVLGRQAWLGRRGEAKLPTHVRFVIEGPISFEHDSGPVRGEVGVDLQAISEPNFTPPLHLFMYKSGCLLGRAELELGLPYLWLVIDAEFEPNDDYTDAVRDQGFVAILLHGLAALREPLVGLLAQFTNTPSEASVRGLIKRWLLALVDPKAQRSLLTGAGADVGPGFFVTPERLLPGLLSDPASIAALPLFESLADVRLSLAELAERTRDGGQLRYSESRPKDPRLVEPDVVFLGPGDRKIVRALFGEARLAPWDASAKQRELEFWDREQTELAAAWTEAGTQLASEGAVVDAVLVDLPEGRTRGFVHVDLHDPDYEDIAELGLLRVVLRHHGRELICVDVEAFGPAWAVIEHPDLKPTDSWDDVVRDAAYAQVLADIHAVIPELIRRACAGLEAQPEPVRRWLARVLLHNAARRPELAPLVEAAPLLATVDGGALSLARARELGELGFASRELGSAPIHDPPILVAEEHELDDLRAVLGDVLADASDRVRHHGIADRLVGRPTLREAKLDPAATLVRGPLQGEGLRGEIAIPSDRVRPGLWLKLGFAGHEVAQISADAGFSIPVDAVAIDDALPFGADGEVDQQSKRVRALLRQCRRRVPELIVELCRRWPELRTERRDVAWQALLAYLLAEADQQERGKARERAFEAASAVPLFDDIRGGSVSLAAALAAAGSGPIRVLTRAQFEPIEGQDLPPIEQHILIVTPDELECLRAHDSVQVLDDEWEDELERLRTFAAAPRVERPKFKDVALVYRKATVAGGLTAELWIPRDRSPFADEPLRLTFVKAEREVGDGSFCDLLPCLGLLGGDRLELVGTHVLFDERQAASVERQQLILYVELAKLAANGRLAPADHERALEYLSWAAHHIDASPDQLRGHKNHLATLRQALVELVPPSLRAAVGRRLQPALEEVEPELEPLPDYDPEPEPEPEPEPAPALGLAITPEQRLLHAIVEQLHWARARHRDLLDDLLLDNMQIRAWGRGELAELDRRTLALNRDHPIVARLLGQATHDPIELGFLVAALYTLLNYEAEEISDDDERAFVAQLAEALALATRVDPA